MARRPNSGRRRPADPDDWGPYRPNVDEKVSRCIDHLSRVRRSLAGGIAAPERREFHQAATELLAAAGDLVWHGRDVERSLAECDARFETGPPEDRYLTRCARPAGHRGAHDDAPPLSPGQRAVDAARSLYERTRSATGRIATHATDAERPPSGRAVSDTRFWLAATADDLDELAADAASLAGELRGIAGVRERPARAAGRDLGAPTSPDVARWPPDLPPPGRPVPGGLGL